MKQGIRKNEKKRKREYRISGTEKDRIRSAITETRSKVKGRSRRESRSEERTQGKGNKERKKSKRTYGRRERRGRRNREASNQDKGNKRKGKR